MVQESFFVSGGAVKPPTHQCLPRVSWNPGIGRACNPDSVPVSFTIRVAASTDPNPFRHGKVQAANVRMTTSHRSPPQGLKPATEIVRTSDSVHSELLTESLRERSSPNVHSWWESNPPSRSPLVGTDPTKGKFLPPRHGAPRSVSPPKWGAPGGVRRPQHHAGIDPPRDRRARLRQ